MGCSIRLLRRLLVLGIGAFSVWLNVFVIFRIADNRLPWVLAVTLTYVISPSTARHAACVVLAPSATKSVSLELKFVPVSTPANAR